MTGDKTIRYATAAVVVAVATFAAIVSFSHIYDLGRAHGQAGTAARLLPLSVDGLIVAASLVMLHEARNARPAPARAWLMLGLGIGATIAANMVYGIRYGWLAAIVSAWPAVSFVGAVEMVMWMIRKARPEAAEPPPIGLVPGTVPSSVLEAAKASMAATLAMGNPWSVNQLQQQFSLTRSQATRVRQAVFAGSNGQAPE